MAIAHCLAVSPGLCVPFNFLLDFSAIFYRKIVSRIDGDKDGFVTVDGLKDWINLHKSAGFTDVERQWKGHDLNEDGLVSWEEYKNATYGSF